MRRLLPLLKGLLIFTFSISTFTACAYPVFAATNTPQFAPTLSPQIDKQTLSGLNDTSDVKIFLNTPLQGYDISSFDFEVTYNKNVVQAVSINPTSPFDDPVTATISNGLGKVHYAKRNTSLKPLFGKLLLGSIAFKAAQNGSTIISFQNVKIYDIHRLDPITVEIKNATLIASNTQQSGVQPTGSFADGAPIQTPTPTPPDCIENGVPGKMTDFGCIPQNPVLFVQKLYGIGLGLIGGIAILFIIYAGYLIMTSQGNHEQLSKAKSYIFYSIIGLLLAIFGFVFIQVIARDILKIPGFN